MKELVGGCPAERTLHLITGRWKLIILRQLMKAGTLRFAELRRRVDSGGLGARTLTVTPKMLTQELRQMEADGLVRREIYPQVPPKVEYSLTPLGESLYPVLQALAAWGREHEPASAVVTAPGGSEPADGSPRLPPFP